MTAIEPKEVDWRKNAERTDFDADDEELPQTPPDVIAALGFDPREFSDENTTKAAGKDFFPEIIKCRNSDTKPKDEKAKKDEMRDAAQARYQSAVDEFTAHAKANALAKKKKSREEMVAIFLLLMLDAGEDAYHVGYLKLEQQNLPLAPVASKVLKKETEDFAQGRQKLLSKFPAATLQRFEDALAESEDDASEKEIRSLLNKAAEIVKAGTGRIVAETEAQATYGSAELKVLQRAGFKTVRWVTMEDERVRKSHVECGEQPPVKLGSPFVNGLRFPGDPNGSASEIINCRCWLEGVSK